MLYKFSINFDEKPMEEDFTQDISQILEHMEKDPTQTGEELLPRIYKELRALAGGLFKAERLTHTLQPTALVHEAFLKLVNSEQRVWKSRAHFMSLAALAMRRILTSYARRKKASKRGRGVAQVTLSGLVTPAGNEQIELIALDEALGKLAKRYPRQCKIVEMRFLAGMSVEEVAHVLGITERTVYVDWRLAKAFLRREMTGNAPS